MPRRNRYQFGNLELQKRIKGPAVWIFRYRDREQPDVTRPAVTLGTIADYPSQTAARRAAEGLRLKINHGLPLREAVTFQGLIDRYTREEIEQGELAHTTKETDLNRINKHISPRWGTCLLKEVKPYPVQDWLRKLAVAPKTKSHLRGLMYRLFEKAMLWELIPYERNPMGLVELKGVSKRLKPPRLLTEDEFVALVSQLVQPYKSMVLVAGCTGLRISEVLGLRWQAVDFERLVMVVTEGYARSQSTKLKSECSQDELPLDPDVATILLEWQRLCPKTDGNWVFPSPRTNHPYDSGSLRAKVLQPAAQRAKIEGTIGWHSLRHSYRAWLDETGVPLGVQQKLMRHANISTTMNVYGGAFMDAKRKANTSVVQRVLSQKQSK
ncbi:MAG TPA: site-specific integrase [Candidatus Sulfotelmatobacter sp.]|nr:site-specific integrase [Candidatus Sulfotelmatobacter sp.]